MTQKPGINPQETQVEIITAGLLMIALALLALGVIGQEWAMLICGLILLGSGVYQTRKGWHVGLLTWIVGIVLTMGGIGVRLFVVAAVQINYVALTLIIIGAYLVLSHLRR